MLPFFGICLGLQCAVIEFARNVCGIESANSSEFLEDGPDPVIALLDEVGSPGTVAQVGGRFFGLVNGGAVPAALAARVLADTWDQNATVP